MVYSITRLLRRIRRRRGLGVAFVLGVLLLAVAGNTGTFYLFEASAEDPPTVWDSFWYSVISITTIGYGDFSATTLGARIGTAVFIIVIGLAAFTTVIGMTVDWIVEIRHKERRGMGSSGARDHLVIVNFPNESRVRQIIEEFTRDVQHRDREIVLITDQIEELPFSIPNVVFVRGSPLEEETYRRANVAQARQAIVLSTSYDDPRSDSLVASISFVIEKMSPRASIIVECLDPRHQVLFTESRRVSRVYTLQVANNLLVQEAQDPGVNLMTQAITSNVVEIEETLASTTVEEDPERPLPYIDAAKRLLDHGVNLIGVVRDGRRSSVSRTCPWPRPTRWSTLARPGIAGPSSALSWPDRSPAAMGALHKKPRTICHDILCEARYGGAGAVPLPIEVVGEIGGDTKEGLRRTLLHSYSNFGVYRSLFRDGGISHDDLENGDPVDLLRRLPPLNGRRFYELAEESITAVDGVIDMETSSGTTGPRKRRVITRRDESSETEFLARLFGVCGVVGSDSVACLDTGPLTLMVSLTKALDALGVRDAYAYCAGTGTDTEQTVTGLARLDPTVVVTIPSLLDRYLDALKRHFGTASGASLREIIYVGEPISSRARSFLTSELGVEVFGYYGASETSALGIECKAHEGIHLFTDRNIVELAGAEQGGATGEVLVTTLHQEGLPLLRYALRDLVTLKTGPCPCGLTYPRVDVAGRTDGTTSLLGVKVSYEAALEAVYSGSEPPGPMEVVLTRNGREKLTIVLPERLAGSESKIRGSLARREPDLTFLVASKFLELELAFVDDKYFARRRKPRRIIDRREAADGVSC